MSRPVRLIGLGLCYTSLSQEASAFLFFSLVVSYRRPIAGRGPGQALVGLGMILQLEALYKAKSLTPTL